MRTRWMLVMMVAACGGGGGSVSIDDYAAKYKDAICDNSVKCGYLPDRATCEAVYFDNTTFFQTVVADVKAGKVDYDEGAASDCISEIKNASCHFEGYHRTSRCSEVFTGTVAAAGSCFLSAECADTGTCTLTGGSCDPSTMCCAGACEADKNGAAGATCNVSGDCADGLYCSLKSSTCVAIGVGDNAACEGFDGCADPMFCDLDFMTYTGTCYTLPQKGEACDKARIFPCGDANTYCGPDNTCIDAKQIGEACTDYAECPAYGDCVSNVCAVYPASPGATCDYFCLGDLTCDSTSKTCLAPSTLLCQ